MVALAPLVDVLVLLSILLGNGPVVLLYFALFLGVESLLCVCAMLIEGSGWSLLPLVLPMRIAYRPLLALVIWKVLLRALKGRFVGWGKLERTAGAIPGGNSVPVPRS